jgi:alpha-glucosidase
MSDATHTSDTTAAPAWWRRAVTYQVYVRSFADGNGDGIGDLTGLRSRLSYLRDLGVDALWCNPWYPSPLLDGGYDVADYREIDPRIGTVEEVEQLVEEAHALGIKVLADLVPNHTSWDHAWFWQALEGGPGSDARGRYLFRDGKGPGGDEPPNDWMAVFGGSAWSRARDVPGDGGAEDPQWYLHLFDTSQPDLDWSRQDVRDEFEDVLRFWFDRGIDGFRVVEQVRSQGRD